MNDASKRAPVERIVGRRPCTCHPDDNPPNPCAEQYALDECRKAAEARAAKPRWPNSKITVSAMVVSTEITEEDEGDPRMIEVQLSRESPGLIVLQGITRSDQSIAFFVEQWAALRKAIDTIAALAETHADLMEET